MRTQIEAELEKKNAEHSALSHEIYILNTITRECNSLDRECANWSDHEVLQYVREVSNAFDRILTRRGLNEETFYCVYVQRRSHVDESWAEADPSEPVDVFTMFLDALYCKAVEVDNRRPEDKELVRYYIQKIAPELAHEYKDFK